MRKLAIEFEGSVADARALARAVAYVFEASRLSYGCTYIDGFAMNPSDKWKAGDPRITSRREVATRKPGRVPLTPPRSFAAV